MTNHSPRTVERHCDVAVVGGSASGLAAALQLGQQGRSVIVVDDQPADTAPAELREEVRRHGGEVLAGRVERRALLDGGRSRLELSGGHAVVARRVLDASELDDAADGMRAGADIRTELAEDDEAGAARPSSNAVDWDQRYGGDRLWSGNPNGSLVHEVGAMTPGRALDVGAGEGGDAIWLAEQGWQVTANDISERALARIAAEAQRRGLDVDCLHADANGADPFGDREFDLVSAQYASIPRTPDDRGVHNLLRAVAPGGTLLVVSHDLAPMRGPVDVAIQSRPFDPDAYVRTDDVVAVLAASPGWELDVHETRPRPPGAASAGHHVDDVVLRARRTP